MKVEVDLDWELVDKVMEAKLLESYRDLIADIKANSWGEDDTEHFKKVVEGLDLVGPWFVHNWDKKKKAKK